MSLKSVLFLFFIASVIYFIAALQVYWGFPPFYRRFRLLWLWGSPDFSEDKRQIMLVLPFVFAMTGMIVLLGLTGSPVIFLIIGVFSVWAGLRLRLDLIKNTDGPLPWLTDIWISCFPLLSIKWVEKRPMMFFDIWTLSWTLGFSLAFTLLVLF